MPNFKVLVKLIRLHPLWVSQWSWSFPLLNMNVSFYLLSIFKHAQGNFWKQILLRVYSGVNLTHDIHCITFIWRQKINSTWGGKEKHTSIWLYNCLKKKEHLGGSVVTALASLKTCLPSTHLRVRKEKINPEKYLWPLRMHCDTHAQTHKISNTR